MGARPWGAEAGRHSLLGQHQPGTAVFPNPTVQKLAWGLDRSKDFAWQLGKEGLLC